MIKASSSSIEQIAVLGAGTMGHGIAQICALSGFKAHLFDLSDEVLQTALDKIKANLEKGVQKGKVSAQAKADALERLTLHTQLTSAVQDCDMVIEAVPERLALKHELLGQVCQHCGPSTILGTNTSSLSVHEIAAPLPRPEQVIGLHFFNPAHIMKLLEVVTAPETSEETQRRALAFGQAIGKETIVVKDTPGFATSRLGLVIGLEAIRMVEQGVASAQDIDKAMTLGYGFPMGPLRLTDLVGLDVRLQIARYLCETLSPGEHFRPPQLLLDMVAAGKLGKKSGQGFYTWP